VQLVLSVDIVVLGEILVLVIVSESVMHGDAFSGLDVNVISENCGVASMLGLVDVNEGDTASMLGFIIEHNGLRWGLGLEFIILDTDWVG
jgi:hypothetical protein